MSKNSFDVAIIGAGVAGSFALSRLISHHKSSQKIAIFEIGRPPGKRRRQIEGWMGCFPFGDGKLYLNQKDKIEEIAGKRATNKAWNWSSKILQEVAKTKTTKNSAVSAAFRKTYKSLGFEIEQSDYLAWKPTSVHSLSRILAESLEPEEKNNVTSFFDTEAVSITRNGDKFIISARNGENYTAEKLLLCPGRSGWRWLRHVYESLQVPFDDTEGWFGIRAELPARMLGELKRSNFTLSQKDLIVGPFSWGGTVIPEDHADLVIASFRSNEDRWKSDKVSFPILKKMIFEKNNASEELDRLGKLTYLLANDRVNKERTKLITKGESCTALLPEYAWLPSVVKYLDENLISNLISHSYYYVPEILTQPPKITLSPSFSISNDFNIWVAGESTGQFGLISAMLSAVVAADNIVR